MDRKLYHALRQSFSRTLECRNYNGVAQVLNEINPLVIPNRLIATLWRDKMLIVFA